MFEIVDINEIGRLLRELATNLISLCNRHVPQRINTQAGQATSTPIITHYFKQEPRLWFAHRQFQRQPQAAPQYNNLFGYDQPGALGSRIEVNFPVGKFRRGNLQGAFVQNRESNAVLLAHRGKVTIGRRSSVSILDAMETMGAPLIRVSGNSSPLIRVCTVDSPQIEEIRDFVRNVTQAKASS